MTFKTSLQIGDSGESFVHHILDQAGIPWKKSPSKSLHYDIAASGITGRNDVVYIEVKHDVMAARTGNIALEFYNTKKGADSGIAATTADFWIIVLTEPPSAYITSVKTLRQYLTNNAPVRTVHGGDDNARMHLYRKNEILPAIFKPLLSDDIDDVLGKVA